MKRHKEFFVLSNKKSLFDSSEDSNEEKTDANQKTTTPSLLVNDEDSDENELEEFLKKNTQDAKRKNLSELKNDPNKKTATCKRGCLPKDDTDDLIIINDIDTSEILIDGSLSLEDSVNILHNVLQSSRKYTAKTKTTKRKTRERQIEKNLKKLAEPPTINSTTIRIVDTPELMTETVKAKVLVMVFFKGVIKKYLIESQQPLIESLTPKIKQNYPETTDTPLHFFKFYDEENKLLDFAKTPENLQIKYADSIDCIIVPTEGDEEDFRTDMISVKFQDGTKHPVVLKTKPSDAFELLFEKYADKTNKNLDQIKFYFDGDPLTKNQSPCDIDMDEDFCIDVVFV